MTAVFDPTPCLLGEGLLWSPPAQTLLWFDIPAGRLHCVGPITQDPATQDPETDRPEAQSPRAYRPEAQASWVFGECVSAAGWIDADEILLASETRLIRFNLVTGAQRTVAALEADNPKTRSNDGRADPFGGFWIGTMGKKAEPGAGAIYRWYRGTLRQLYRGITVPNAICFAADGTSAYFTDTPSQKVHRVALDRQGWPQGAPETWLDLTGTGWWPDGAVIDAEGVFWNAQWDGARLAAYAPDGTFLRALAVPVRRPTCPAFGGADFDRLFCSSARIGLGADCLKRAPLSGAVLELAPGCRGRAEPAVLL